MRKINKITAVGVVTAAVLSAGAAFAGTSYVSYNTTVGKLNGNGYTGYQTQSVAGATSNLRSTSVGGIYKVDARINGPKNGAWTRDVTDNQTRNLSNDNAKGASVRVQFSNGALTPVDVQVTGSWRSN